MTAMVSLSRERIPPKDPSVPPPAKSSATEKEIWSAVDWVLCQQFKGRDDSKGWACSPQKFSQLKRWAVVSITIILISVIPEDNGKAMVLVRIEAGEPLVKEKWLFELKRNRDDLWKIIRVSKP
jgi:hypothetical protein